MTSHPARVRFGLSALVIACVAAPTLAQDLRQAGTAGERVPASAISPLVIEGMAAVLERQKLLPPDVGVRGVWNGEDGQWQVPALDVHAPAHSGQKSIHNQWGDPRMGIGFPARADVQAVWAAGSGGAAASAVRFVGFANGVKVAQTEWLGLGATMRQCKLEFVAIDRLEVQIEPVAGKQGWLALDDLAFSLAGSPRVLDFEDLPWRHVLTGTRYAGLDWESGRGFRDPIEPSVHAPRVVEQKEPAVDSSWSAPAAAPVTAPSIWADFNTVKQGDAGANLIPPDTCGAAGIDQIATITNSNLSVYRKSDQVRVLSTSLTAFFPGASGTVGDPRIVFDPHALRWVAMATNFNTSATIYLAYSATPDALGAWFKFSYQTNQGTDAGKWPDYPTLGVDARGIYLAAYMVGGSSLMTIWAIDKAPLLANPPALGTITAFRSLPWEGAIQPCTTYGDPGSEYLISRQSSTGMRIRRIAPPLTAPVLFEVGTAPVPAHSSAPTAPALGSTTNINTIDYRPMNAVFRNGSVWTAHNVAINARAGCRWYEIGVAPVATKQTGTIADALWHYYFASIAVDANGNVGIGFSGSHANAYCSTFFTGRQTTDAAGETATPIMTKAGEGPWNRTDGSGRNRFGDYSHTTVDPVDNQGLWTFQEFILPGNLWATRATRIGYEAVNYGAGLAGTTGIPHLRAAARPVIAANLTLKVGNSLGSGATPGALVIGGAKASTPLFGGTLLAQPAAVLGLTVSVPELSLPLAVPNNPAMINAPLFFQALVVDPAASQGFAFTPGLEVRCGSK